MKSSTDILEELKAISPVVAEVPRVNVFYAPEGYFHNLSELMLYVVKAESFLPGYQSNIQSVPAGYFEGLSNQILDKIKESENIQTAKEELAGLSPTLSAIGNKNVFRVPNNYFQQSKKAIAASTRHTAKVVRMRIAAKNIWKYAVAAVFAGVISYFSLTLFSSNNDASLAENAVSEETLKAAKDIIANNNFDQMLASISDKDIAIYLENRGLDVEAALVAASMETAVLPEPEDYLFDENTLNEFLSEQNIQ